MAKGLFNWRGVRGGQNEITVFWLSIWDDFFKLTIYVPEKAMASDNDFGRKALMLPTAFAIKVRKLII